jgi:hypothetical protein
MRTATIAILGSPFACWALHGCLEIMGVADGRAILVSIAWGILWLAVAHIGGRVRLARLMRVDQPIRRRGARGGRGMWAGAVLSSCFLPLPVWLLTLLFDRLHIAPASMMLPVFALLALPVPTALWCMLLRPSSDGNEEIMRPLGWRRYTPHAPAGVIPPRGGWRAGR